MKHTNNVSAQGFYYSYQICFIYAGLYYRCKNRNIVG